MAILLAVFVAIASSVSAVLQVPSDHLALIEHGSSERLSKMMANMSTLDAIRVVPSLPKNLRKQLQRKLKKVSFLQHSGSLDKKEEKDEKEGNGEKGADEARELLNAMGTEAEVGLDAEKIRCSELLDRQAKALQSSRDELNNFNAQGASARGRILEAQGVISAAQELLPTLNDELVGHRKKCQENRLELLKQLKTAQGDQEVIAGILPKTECNAALLQCEQVADYSDVTFRHPALRGQLALLQNTAVRKLVRRTLNSIGSIHHVRKHSHDSREQFHRQPKVAAPGSTARAKSQSRCSIRNNPNCQTLRDKFLMMSGEIGDQVKHLQREITDGEASCETTEEGYLAQISDSETKLNDAQTVLAQSTKVALSAQEQCRLLDISIAELETEETQISTECDKSLSDIEMEICGIKQIRQELYKMASQQQYIQDCQVSEWTEEDCSASCEGGTQKLTRSVQVPAEMGMKCPPLEMYKSCNDFTCPLDCILEDWTGWSACSAKCGGGVMQRVRGIGRQSAHGGEPCGATSDSGACMTQSCDKDCVLSDWTLWSNCTKECGVGSMVRIKDITEVPLGAGECSKDGSEERLERKQCNTDKCKIKAADGILHCKSMLDVVLLLDSSGSVSEDGWEATKKAGETLVSAFSSGPAGTLISVLDFSGPYTWDAYYRCMDGTTKDFEDDCKVKWLTHWSSEPETTTKKIADGEFSKGSTLTSAALAMAEAEFGNGRRDAKKLTIVITDGRPLSIDETRDAAYSLRKVSRLMFVPVTAGAPIADIQDWATYPPAENVIIVEGFDELASKETANRILGDACPNLEDQDEQ